MCVLEPEFSTHILVNVVAFVDRVKMCKHEYAAMWGGGRERELALVLIHLCHLPSHKSVQLRLLTMCVGHACYNAVRIQQNTLYA